MTLDLFAPADLGASAAANHANAVENGWTERAVDDLRRFARTAVRPLTIEQARAHCCPTPQGCDARAWGVVTRIAMRRGYIVFAGDYCPAVSSHGSPKPTYQRGEA